MLWTLLKSLEHMNSLFIPIPKGEGLEEWKNGPIGTMEITLSEEPIYKTSSS